MVKNDSINERGRLPCMKAPASLLFKSANPRWGGVKCLDDQFNIRIRHSNQAIDRVKRLFYCLLYVVYQNYLYKPLINSVILKCICNMTPLITLSNTDRLRKEYNFRISE